MSVADGTQHLNPIGLMAVIHLHVHILEYFLLLTIIMVFLEMVLGAVESQSVALDFKM